jgi:hypothetical protein
MVGKIWDWACFFLSALALGDLASRFPPSVNLLILSLFLVRICCRSCLLVYRCHRHRLLRQQVFISHLLVLLGRISIPDTTYQPAEATQLSAFNVRLPAFPDHRSVLCSRALMMRLLQ